jgi:hypothetical protein
MWKSDWNAKELEWRFIKHNSLSELHSADDQGHRSREGGTSWIAVNGDNNDCVIE